MTTYSVLAAFLVLNATALCQELPPPVRKLVPAAEYNPPPKVAPSYLPNESPFAPRRVGKPTPKDVRVSNYRPAPSVGGAVAGQGKLNPKKDGVVELPVRTELPGPERLFRRDSEAEVYQRIIEENRKPGRAGKIPFPVYDQLASQPHMPAERRIAWPQAIELVEPSYLCHDRLLFQHPNFDRYGWDLGVFQPLVSTSAFFADVVMLPYNISKRPFENYECSAGQCLPGDPTPFLLYPPELSVTGLAGQAAATAGVLFLFP